MVILQVSALLSGDPWPDLSNAALGAWVRLRASSELTGEPVSSRTAERLGLTAEVLAELTAAGVVAETGGRYDAVGMPDPPRKPSDEPDAARERQEASRLGISVAELRARKLDPSPAPPPVRSGQIRSGQIRSGQIRSGVTRDNALSRPVTRDRASADVCSRGCGRPSLPGNRIVNGRHRTLVGCTLPDDWRPWSGGDDDPAKVAP